MVDGLSADVLIVGAGPVGVTLAGLLADRGCSVIACDASTEVYPLPRAAHLDHEALRLFQQLGVINQILPHTRPAPEYEFLTADRKTLLAFAMPVDGSPSGWPASNMINQPPIERALRAKLEAASGAQLKLGWTFESFAETPSGIRAHFATPDGAQQIEARFLVACDGASSTVRKAANIDLDDYDFDEPWLVVDTRVLDPAAVPKHNLQICDPERPTTCVLMGPGRHRWEFMLKPGEDPEPFLEDETIWQLLEPWQVAGAVTLERRAIYRFHALVARQWRRGRVLLAGDAAHQMPPFAGQGLCSGLRDAGNLAWKLAAVLEGAATDALLATYQQEREPQVRQIIETSLMMGRTVCVTDPAAAAERDAQMLAARQRGESTPGAAGPPPLVEGVLLPDSPGAGDLFPQSRSGSLWLDDQLGAGPWLLTRQPTERTDGLRTVALSDEILAPFRTNLEHWLDKRAAEAVLVRPDRIVFGTGAAAMLSSAYFNQVQSTQE